MNPKRRGVCVLAIVIGAAVACAGKINQANYDKVATGMSPQEVEAILGPGTEQASTSVAIPTPPVALPSGISGMAKGSISSKVLTWRSGGRMITVTFVNDKVAAKAQVGL